MEQSDRNGVQMNGMSRRDAITEACNQNCECFYQETKERMSATDWYAWLAIGIAAIVLVYLGYLA